MPLFTSGGSQVNSASIIDGSIVNADINAAAAIAASKITGLSFVELADVTLGSAGLTLSSGAFTGRLFLRVYVLVTGMASAGSLSMRFNGDTGANYNTFYSVNSGADATSLGATTAFINAASGTTERAYFFDIFAPTTTRKNWIGDSVDSNGHIEMSGWWNNTANALTQIDIIGSVNINVGSRIVVFGHD